MNQVQRTLSDVPLTLPSSPMPGWNNDLWHFDGQQVGAASAVAIGFVVAMFAFYSFAKERCRRDRGLVLDGLPDVSCDVFYDREFNRWVAKNGGLKSLSVAKVNTLSGAILAVQKISDFSYIEDLPGTEPAKFCDRITRQCLTQEGKSGIDKAGRFYVLASGWDLKQNQFFIFYPSATPLHRAMCTPPRDFFEMADDC